jgi:hypothetical protein
MVRHVSVTLTDATGVRLEQMKIPPTRICNAMIEWFLNEYEADIGKLFILEHVREQVTRLEIEVAQLEHKKAMLKVLKRELQLMEEEYKDSNNKLELHYLMSYLNRRIIAYKYNLREIKLKQKDTIDKIRKLNPQFALEKHVNKIRLMREETII